MYIFPEMRSRRGRTAEIDEGDAEPGAWRGSDGDADTVTPPGAKIPSALVCVVILTGRIYTGQHQSQAVDVAVTSAHAAAVALPAASRQIVARGSREGRHSPAVPVMAASSRWRQPIDVSGTVSACRYFCTVVRWRAAAGLPAPPGRDDDAGDEPVRRSSALNDGFAAIGERR